MPLSVLSALARLNVDPWQEAADLASLPKEAAIQRLTGLIEELPGGTPTRRGPAANVAALIGLLPHRADPVLAARQGLFAVGAKPNLLAIAYVVVMMIMLGSQLFIEDHASSAQPAGGRAPATVMTSPSPAPPPSIGP